MLVCKPAWILLNVRDGITWTPDRKLQWIEWLITIIGLREQNWPRESDESLIVQNFDPAIWLIHLNSPTLDKKKEHNFLLPLSFFKHVMQLKVISWICSELITYSLKYIRVSYRGCVCNVATSWGCVFCNTGNRKPAAASIAICYLTIVFRLLCAA
jgi:hypothetical protein